MRSITIRIPQNIQIEYTLNHESITHRILDMLNTLLLRSDQPELIDQITEEAMEARMRDVLRVAS